MGYDTVYCVVTTNDVENIQYCTQNSLKIEAAHSSNMLVTTYNRLQDAIILDITTQFFTAVKRINIYTHIHNTSLV